MLPASRAFKGGLVGTGNEGCALAVAEGVFLLGQKGGAKWRRGGGKSGVNFSPLKETWAVSPHFSCPAWRARRWKRTRLCGGTSLNTAYVKGDWGFKSAPETLARKCAGGLQ